MRGINAALLLLLATLVMTVRGFEFFQQLFGNGQRQQEKQGRADSKQNGGDSSAQDGCMSGYVCPDTPNICVTSPEKCPCPPHKARKCVVGDWYMCMPERVDGSIVDDGLLVSLPCNSIMASLNKDFAVYKGSKLTGNEEL